MPSTTTRSTTGIQVRVRCSTTTTVAPPASAAAVTASRTSRTPSASRFAVGSSSRIRPGFIASTPASARRCFWPPDRVEVSCDTARFRPTEWRAVSTRGQIAARGTAKFSMPNATSSPTRDRITCESGSCSTIPMRPRRSAGRTPSTRRRPVSCPSSAPPSRPARPSSRVDLPEPDGPSTRTRWPASMSRSSSLTAQLFCPACCQPHCCAVTRAPTWVDAAAGIRWRNARTPGRTRSGSGRRSGPDL